MSSSTLFSSDTILPAKREAPSDIEYQRANRSTFKLEAPSDKNVPADNQASSTSSVSTRRRVNPDSLAMRLGPELVAELQSYVKPGAFEMPSFAIRQDIQKRYDVDRRHIYDWFHSKGLRVTKEDKRATVEQKTDTMRMHRRMRRSGIVPPPTAKAQPRVDKAATKAAKPVPVAKHNSVPKPSVPAPPLAVMPPRERDLSPDLSVDYETPSAWFSVLELDHLQPTLALSEIQFAQNSLDTLCDEFFEPSCAAVYEDVVLNQGQRISHYDTLSRTLGPPSGIQEQVGTYSAYMAKQAEIYYERILSPASSVSDASVTPPVGIAYPSRLCAIGNVASSYNVGLGLFSCHTPSSGSLDGSCCSDTSSLDDQDASLELSDILSSPDTISASPTPPRTRTVSFAVNSSMHLAQSDAPFKRSSSSLAGALGELVAAPAGDHGTRRMSKEWTRPRMGRARAYSAGGGM